MPDIYILYIPLISPHKPLHLSRGILPSKGFVQEQVEDDNVDENQGEKLQGQLDHRAGFNLESGDEEGNYEVSELQKLLRN